MKKLALFVIVLLLTLAATLPTFACPPPTWDIDIKPWSFPNSINLKSRGTIPVAILNPTPTMGMNFTFAGAPAVRCGWDYANGDATLDYVCHFKTQATNLTEFSTSACLSGEGRVGCDSVNIVQPPK
jgi:hypothetical protein